jgi:hypothetical protein
LDFEVTDSGFYADFSKPQLNLGFAQRQAKMSLSYNLTLCWQTPAA